MNLGKLIRLDFERNVGAADRVFRVLSGVALTASGWYLGLATWVSVVLGALGLMWVATGVLSKCTIYYALGYSSCPVRSHPE